MSVGEYSGIPQKKRGNLLSGREKRKKSGLGKSTGFLNLYEFRECKLGTLWGESSVEGNKKGQSKGYLRREHGRPMNVPCARGV